MCAHVYCESYEQCFLMHELRQIREEWIWILIFCKTYQKFSSCSIHQVTLSPFTKSMKCSYLIQHKKQKVRWLATGHCDGLLRHTTTTKKYRNTRTSKIIDSSCCWLFSVWLRTSESKGSSLLNELHFIYLTNETKHMQRQTRTLWWTCSVKLELNLNSVKSCAVLWGEGERADSCLHKLVILICGWSVAGQPARPHYGLAGTNRKFCSG